MHRGGYGVSPCVNGEGHGKHLECYHHHHRGLHGARSRSPSLCHSDRYHVNTNTTTHRHIKCVHGYTPCELVIFSTHPPST
jgi:hypothetical protein